MKLISRTQTMIKKLIKYGTIAGASFVAGAYTHLKVIGKPPMTTTNSEEPTTDVWRGETNTVVINSHFVYDILEHIEDSRENEPYHDAIFADEDLAAISIKIRHSLADVDENTEYFGFEIELSDRERLRAIENTPKDYTDCFTNPK